MSATQAPSDPTTSDATDASGLAHLAAVSYLGSRLAPTGGYCVALAGGVAVARATARHGLRVGYGASMAGLAQSVAIMGPARLSIPLTQAVSAPLMGALEGRRARLITQIAVAAVVRMALASEPAPGSVSPKAPSLAPEHSCGSHSWRCASDPKAWIG